LPQIQLTVLNIADNSIGGQGKLAFTKAFQAMNIQYLICDEWSIREGADEVSFVASVLSEADASMLGAIIQKNKSVVREIPAGRLQHQSKADEEQINSEIELNCRNATLPLKLKDRTLPGLDLSNFGIATKAEAASVGRYVRENTALVFITLSGNAMGSKAMEAFCDNLLCDSQAEHTVTVEVIGELKAKMKAIAEEMTQGVYDRIGLLNEMRAQLDQGERLMAVSKDVPVMAPAPR
jgi:hypothetical protein